MRSESQPLRNASSNVAYVSLDCSNVAARDWVHSFFASCVQQLPLDPQCGLLEEAFLGDGVCIAAFVAKLAGDDAYGLARRHVEEWAKSCLAGVHLLAIEGVDDTTPVSHAAVEVTYYRDPTKVDGLVVWVDSCVRLHHTPSGIEASCQAFRSRARNMEEASALLKSRLAWAGVQDAI